MATIEFWIGVDGGGTGTRLRLQRANGERLAQAAGGPSGLMHGIDKAWAVVESCIDMAFAQAGLARPARAHIAIGLGLAGVHNRQWARAFIEHDANSDQPFGLLALETDALTTLLGAHGGQPGAIVALGTGSVGEALLPDGSRREVSGWGFPVGDEASGAWLGLRAVQCLQQALDGRAIATPFSAALLQQCGGNRDALFVWLAQANQTRYAQLAPLVIEFADNDAAAQQIMREAALEVAKMASALDPAASLPLALCGGLAHAIQPHLPASLQARLTPPQDDAVGGALHLVRQQLAQQAKQTQQASTQPPAPPQAPLPSGPNVNQNASQNHLQGAQDTRNIAHAG